MPCYCPLDAYRVAANPENPKGGVTFNPRHPYRVEKLKLACGQCMGCRLEQTRQWAVRCVHENQMHDESCFVTLTYNDDHLPYGMTLVPKDIQNFMKRLKRPRPGKVRQVYCGEYGDETHRPHYHALLFGYRPDDPELFQKKDGYTTYTSHYLTQTWGMGHVSFGDVTFESAAYCAGYTRKKVTGAAALEHYRVTDPETGEIIDRIPEFFQASRRPGIGTSWLEKYGQQAYEKDQVVMRAKAFKPPRAYDKWFEITDPETWKTVRQNRQKDVKNRVESQRVRDGSWYDTKGNVLGERYVDVKYELHSDRRLYDGQIIAQKRAQNRKEM